MTTEKQADLTIIRHDKTDGMISVYRGNRHLGQIYPALGYRAVPDDGREPRQFGDDAQAIAYLAA
jgi:hypothetical protein